MLGAFLFYCRGGLDVEAVAPVPAAAMAAAVAAATACMAADVATAVADAVAVIAAPMLLLLLLHAAASAKSTLFILDLVRFKFSILGRLPEDSGPCSRTGTVTSVMTEVRICGQNPEGPKVEVQEIWNERARA